MSYYIDGTIDSIEIAIGEEKAVRFTLLPSTEFLKTVAKGEKKALLIEKSGKTALISEPTENEKEKEILKFEISNADCSLKCLLLEAKNNRNNIRVFVASKAGLSQPSSINIL